MSNDTFFGFLSCQIYVQCFELSPEKWIAYRLVDLESEKMQNYLEELRKEARAKFDSEISTWEIEHPFELSYKRISKLREDLEKTVIAYKIIIAEDQCKQFDLLN